MGSNLLLGLSGLLLICAVFGCNDRVYVRGKKEGAYTVPGVGGTFQNSPSTGEHGYVDEQGNGFVNQGAGQHSAEKLSQQGNSYRNQPQGTKGANSETEWLTPDFSNKKDNAESKRPESKEILITQPDGYIQFKDGNLVLSRNRRDTRVLQGNLIVHGENVINNGKDVKVLANSSGNKIIVDKFGNILTTSPNGKSFKFPGGN